MPQPTEAAPTWEPGDGLFIVAIAGTLVAGLILRFYGLSSQILLDDEWHGILTVIRALTGGGLSEILTQFNPQDNSSLPLNIYNYLLYHTLGWSEMAIRLPSLIGGMLTLGFLPFMVRGALGRRPALIFAWLLAISPFLIFYSRFARAYSLMALLCFAVLWTAHGWFTSGKRGYAAAFVLAAVVSIYIHPLSVVTVLASFLAAVLSFAAHRSAWLPFPRCTNVSARALLAAGAVILVLLLPLLLPVLSRSGELPWARAEATIEAMGIAATLLSGTMNVPVNLLFFGFCLAGHFLLIRRLPMLGWMFLTTLGAHFAAILVSRPTGADTGIVLLRYMIITVPLMLVAASVALDWGLRFMERTRVLPGSLLFAAALVLPVGLFFTGPWLSTYVGRNDFTGHSAFQGSYAPLDWSRSEARHVYPAFSMESENLSPFYRDLSRHPDIQAIVEYPFDVCNHNDLYYYYQHFHGKRVIAGYCGNPGIAKSGNRIPDTYRSVPAEVSMLKTDVLSVADPEKLHFRNLVDVSNPSDLARARADVIVLHKYIMSLRIVMDGSGTMDAVPVVSNSVGYLVKWFREGYGEPVYEDQQLICFRLRG